MCYEEVLPGIPDVRRDVGIHSVYIFDAVRRHESAIRWDGLRCHAPRDSCKIRLQALQEGGAATEMHCRLKKIAQVCSAYNVNRCRLPPLSTGLSHQGYVQEVRSLTDPRMRHNNILQLKEVFEDVENVYLITERCEEELMKKVAQLTAVSERDVASWLLPFAKAVNHAHINGTVCFHQNQK